MAIWGRGPECRFRLAVGAVGLVGLLAVASACTGDAPATGRTDASPAPGESANFGGPDQGGVQASVVRLADGDSGWFEIDGREVEVRLLGYNAPELNEGDGSASCNGGAAADRLTELLDQAERIEVVTHDTDQFSRQLVDVWADNRSVVDQLVAEGRGLATDDDPERWQLMVEASNNRLGMWGDECGQAPTGLVVSDAQPNPAGRDEEDLNGEWVELTNTGDQPIELEGWDIRDNSSRHRFDLDGRLGPGERLQIRTGRGDPAPGVAYLGSSSPVWSNSSETVLVLDPTGAVAAWLFLP